MRRLIAHHLHRFAYLIDRVADKIWDGDWISYLGHTPEPYPAPTGEQVAQAIQDAVVGINPPIESESQQ